MNIVERISWRVEQMIPHEDALIYIRDKDRRLVWVNDVYCQQTGMRLQELVGHVGDEFFGPNHAKKLNFMDEIILFTEEPMVFREEIERPGTGEHLEYISMKTVVPYENEKYLVGVSIPLDDQDDSGFEESLADLVVQVLRLVRYGIT